MTKQVQAVVRLDDEMIRQLGDVARLLKPQIGQPMTTSDTIRGALELAAVLLPHIAPVAARIGAELGVVNSLRVAIDMVTTSGVQGANKQIDRAVEQLKEKIWQSPATPAVQVIAEVTNLLGGMRAMPIQIPDGRTVVIRVLDGMQKKAKALLVAQKPEQRWPGYQFDVK